jgi:hypothetical protein
MGSWGWWNYTTEEHRQSVTAEEEKTGTERKRAQRRQYGDWQSIYNTIAFNKLHQLQI